jgi:hypothetical protein
MNQKRNDAGAMFNNKLRTKPRSPTMTGVLRLSPNVAVELARRAGNGQPATLKLAGWLNVSATSGDEYLTLRVQLPAAERVVEPENSLMRFAAEDRTTP